MTQKVTIETSDDFMRVEYGRMSGSRLVWRGAGIEIYVKGALKGDFFDSAQHMAMTVCDEMHIPVSSLRYVKASRDPEKKTAPVSETKRMF